MKLLNSFIAIMYTICLVILTVDNISLHKKLDDLEPKIENISTAHKPEAFGGVGYIKAVNSEELYIDAVGYGRFTITADESQFLQVGDKLPTYIMLRGAH